ncbi:MAG: nucleotidyltransferase domain-containing protein [Armatimonadota bacterium]|nr:nucleotidyltransferase domain-containing protein [Armatimonadota bacterium]
MPKRSSPSVRISYPKYSREQLLDRLRERLPALDRQLPLVRVVLFGSWAVGRHTVASDVDLLVVYRGEGREDAFAVVKTTLAIPGLEPHVYPEQEAAVIRDRLARMTAGGVVLFPADTATRGPR